VLGLGASQGLRLDGAPDAAAYRPDPTSRLIGIPRVDICRIGHESAAVVSSSFCFLGGIISWIAGILEFLGTIFTRNCALEKPLISLDGA